MGHILPGHQQGSREQECLSPGVFAHLMSEPATASAFPGLPPHAALLCFALLPPALGGMKGYSGREAALLHSPCQQHLFLLPAVCSHPSVCLHFGAVPMPFA